MFRSRLFGVVIGCLYIILMITSISLASVQGTVLFRADFENDKGNNTLAKWKSNSDGQIWEIAELDMSWQDDDNWGIFFRKSAEKRSFGYLRLQ
ncbi:hypothetical protein CMK18_07600 [Candidatus Poribacteria bacterium]|nr:hypothetical protein [Candidatus Poribacteria bacterium]